MFDNIVRGQQKKANELVGEGGKEREWEKEAGRESVSICLQIHQANNLTTRSACGDRNNSDGVDALMRIWLFKQQPP